MNCGDFDFKQIKILAGQGSIYVKLKDWVYCLISEESNDDDDADTVKGAVMWESILRTVNTKSVAILCAGSFL